MSRLFDPGLQPERTELAWRRTALALGVGSLVAMRLLPAAFADPWWALAGVAGLLSAGALWITARNRARRTNDILLSQGDRAPLPGARPLAALAVIVGAAGVLGLAVVLAVSVG